MYLVAIAWLYVALMMALAEAMHPNGSVLGAIVTFLFYGLLPTGLVVYVMGTPLRRKARLSAEAQELADAREPSASPLQPDRPDPAPNADANPNASAHAKATAAAASTPVEPHASGHAPGAAPLGGVTPVGKPD